MMLALSNITVIIIIIVIKRTIIFVLSCLKVIVLRYSSKILIFIYTNFQFIFTSIFYKYLIRIF